jgi:hypothetical protein
MNPEDIQYIYLLQEREFKNYNIPVYKLGKTKQINNLRFNAYPKGSLLLSQLCCNNCDDCERQIISLFDKKYKNRDDIGREYYEGNYRSMILDIIEVINYRKEIEDQKELEFLQKIEKLEKEILELKKENTGMKNEMSVDSLITEITENKEPENIVEKKEKINKVTNKKYKFSCEICQYYTDDRFRFESHKKSKTHEKREKHEFGGNFECKICKKTYISNVGLWKHKKICQSEV